MILPENNQILGKITFFMVAQNNQNHSPFIVILQTQGNPYDMQKSLTLEILSTVFRSYSEIVSLRRRSYPKSSQSNP